MKNATTTATAGMRSAAITVTDSFVSFVVSSFVGCYFGMPCLLAIMDYEIIAVDESHIAIIAGKEHCSSTGATPNTDDPWWLASELAYLLFSANGS